jgi:5-oxoprolinase (ATP-hydrolysing) subunit A
MEKVSFGDAAWRIALPDGADAASVLGTLRAMPRVLDVVVADGFALIRFAPGLPPEDPRPAIERATRNEPSEPRRHVIPVRYDGIDLDEVARHALLSRQEIIDRHTQREYRVQVIGFLPGFAYLGPVDPALEIPRRSIPRQRVPAGSVAIAAGRTAIYPFSSPGGWNLIGSAPTFKCFDADEGAVFRLGDRVRFEPVE